MISNYETPQWAENGWLVNLSDYAKNTPGYDTNDFIPSLRESLSYNGNMNGNRSDIQGWINPNLTWGEIQWTNTKLSAEQIAGFAGLQVPEPASASLGILGLAVLMMRRRRS